MVNKLKYKRLKERNDLKTLRKEYTKDFLDKNFTSSEMYGVFSFSFLF